MVQGPFTGSLGDSLTTLLVVSSLIPAMTASPCLSCPICYCEDEINLRLYMHQVVSGSTQNQQTMVISSHPQAFGTMAVNDWTVVDAPQANAAIVAGAKGMHVQADQQGAGFFTCLSIVLVDARFSGSTFQVMGITAANGQWAIVGGTGVFANAHGVIKYRLVKSTPFVESYRELDIHAFYTPEAVNATGTASQ